MVLVFVYMSILFTMYCLEFMGNESVYPWMIKIKGLCRHLKMSLSGWTCFAELCAMRHVKILKPPIAGDTRWGGHHQQVLWHTM